MFLAGLHFRLNDHFLAVDAEQPLFDQALLRFLSRFPTGTPPAYHSWHSDLRTAIVPPPASKAQAIASHRLLRNHSGSAEQFRSDPALEALLIPSIALLLA